MQTYRTIAPEDTIFAFCGGGPDQPRMKAMAEEMGLGPAVHFTGEFQTDELWDYLSTADLCVDPDPFTEWSNMSTMNKMIEYMAFGRPIVAFDLLEHRRTPNQRPSTSKATTMTRWHAPSGNCCSTPNAGTACRSSHATVSAKSWRGRTPKGI